MKHRVPVRHRFLRLLVVLLAGLAATATRGQSVEDEYFFRISNVTGGSSNTNYPGYSDAVSFSYSVIFTNSGGGGGAGDSEFSDLVVTKIVDKASPYLLVNCAVGAHAPSAAIVVRSKGQTNEYFKVELTDVLIASVNSGSVSKLAGPPLEQLTLNYATIRLTYTPTNPDGSAGTPSTRGYNVKTGVVLP